MCIKTKTCSHKLGVMHCGTFILTYASKPRVHLPRDITQHRRESTTHGLRNVALRGYRRVCFVWTEESLQRGINVVSHPRYTADEAGGVVLLNVIVNVTEL